MLGEAISDVAAGWRHRHLWTTLAKEEISDQHRQTILGPLWILVNYLLFVGAFVLIFGATSSMEHYALYVATGWLVWTYLADVVVLSPSLFQQEQNFIKGTGLPLTVYVLKLSAQILVRGLYAFIGWLVVIIWSGGLPTLEGSMEALLGVALIIMCTPPTITALAILGALLSDLQFILGNLMRVGIFLTPIFWTPSGPRFQTILAQWNPFTYFLDIVRMPLLYGYLPKSSLTVTVCLILGMSLFALILLQKFRKRIVFTL